MSDSGDNASPKGLPVLSDSKKQALKAKLKGLAKPDALGIPAPKTAEPVTDLEELSASELIEEAPSDGEFRFELADLGVPTPADPGIQPDAPTNPVFSTIDPAELQPLPTMEAEVEVEVATAEILDEEFEDEATQIAEGLSFEEDSKATLDEGLSEVSDFEVEPKKPTFSTSIEDNAASSMELVNSVSGGFESQAPLPAPIPSSAPLPEPIHTDSPVIEDDEDGGFQSQKTEMLSSPFETDELIAKLLVIEGPDTGQEFLVSNMRSTIGRGDMNTIMVGDAAMSRQHLEVAKNDDDTFTVRDLQSVNGTMLNGTRIRESDLFHGDRVEAGKTVLQFILQGDVPPPTRNRRLVPAAMQTAAGATALHDVGVPPPAGPAATNNLVLYVGIIAAVLITIVIASIAFVVSNQKTGDGSDTQAASQLYLQGVDAIKHRDWETAKLSFDQAKTLDPKLAVGPQIDRIDKELAARKAFEDAQKLHDDGEYEKSASRAQAIPEDSVYYEESRLLTTRKKNVEVDALYAKAQDKVTNDDFDGARELIRSIRERVPNHQGASDLEERMKQIELEQQTEKLEQDVAVARREQRELENLAPRPDRPKPSGSKRVINFTRGYGLYRDKKFDEAVSFFQKIERDSSGRGADRARKTAKEIKAFQGEYRKAKLAVAQRKWAEADKAISQARRTDSSVSGGKGYFEKELLGLLASAKGNLGLDAFGQRDYARAYKMQKEGARYGAGDEAVKKLKKLLESEARNLYVKAANKRKTDARGATKLCRQIMSMVPKSSESYQKAEKLLKEI